MLKLKLEQLLAWAGGSCEASAIEIHSVAVDTRLLTPGSLFFALQGAKVDGHHFLKEAQNRGACLACVRKDYSGPVPEGLALWRVADPLQALQTLAKSYLLQLKATVIGITGSFGKTTTKEFTHALLSQRYRCFATLGNYNGQIGLPLSIFAADPSSEVLVLEMGISEAGEMQRLVDVAQPHYSVLLDVYPVHLKGFADFEALKQEKGKILNSPRLIKAFVAQQPKQVVSFPCQWIREAEGLSIEGEHYSWPESIPEHLELNLRAAIFIAKELGLSQLEIEQGLRQLKMPALRYERSEVAGVQFINDSYNASLQTMLTAIRSLPKAKGKRLAVLGQMNELGEASLSNHEQVGRFALDYLDELIVVGKEAACIDQIWKEEGRPCQYFEDVEAAQDYFCSRVRAGDLVFLKGSNSWRLWQLLEYFKGQTCT